MKTPWNTPIQVDRKTEELYELQERVILEISEDPVIRDLQRMQFEYIANSMIPGEIRTPVDELIQRRIKRIIDFAKNGI